MTIRVRTENPRLRAASGAVAAAGLGAAAVIHVAWASGSTWPAPDRDDLAELVIGTGALPGPVLTAGVAGLLAGAAGLAAANGGLVPTPARWRRVVGWGGTTVAAALLLRGTGGLVASGSGLGASSDRYRHWDLALYSPLCLVLGAAVAAARPAEVRY